MGGEWRPMTPEAAMQLSERLPNGIGETDERVICGEKKRSTSKKRQRPKRPKRRNGV
jgi:hypothetical protein